MNGSEIIYSILTAALVVPVRPEGTELEIPMVSYSATEVDSIRVKTAIVAREYEFLVRSYHKTKFESLSLAKLAQNALESVEVVSDKKIYSRSVNYSSDEFDDELGNYVEFVANITIQE